MAEVKMPSREKEYKGHQLVGLHLPSDNNLRAYNKLAYKSGWDEEISDQAEELELLRKNNSDLKRRLKKALMDIGHKEESFVILENRISALQEEINKLKNRIQDLTSRKNKKLSMAQAPNANEVQTLSELSTYHSSNIDSEFTDIRNAVNRLQEISNWEANRANRAQARINQDAQTIIRLNAKSIGGYRVIAQKFQQFRNNSRNLQRNLNTCRDDLLLSDIQIDIKWGKWKNRSRNSEQIITNLNQNIFNLQQQILALHNNPQNMAATVIECSNIIAPSLANILEYIGQEHPDAWYERITKLFLHPTIAGNVNFTDAHKVSVLSSKMADPYHPVPAQNNYVNPAVNIDTPDRFNAWLHSKYAEENVGGMNMGIQVLLREKFSPFDAPESYRDRIRKISIGPYQKLYTIALLISRIACPTNIGLFRVIWLFSISVIPPSKTLKPTYKGDEVRRLSFLSSSGLTPEKGVVPKNWLSPYNKDLVNDSEIGEGKYILGEKLLQTLMPKKNYVVHYRALQLYISLGIKVTKIYEALKFRQSPWMKPYIEENIRKRKIAKASEDEFGVMYYKLKNNAIFGKQMENVRKHMSRI
ncbi:9239_t:CDS:2 [Entrophospora sp. SA101]|nr:9239_t:CDS:2 [Entrophospora sp. SA101]